MIVVLSGEGSTDLGQCMNAQNICDDGDFKVGPMAVLLDQMFKPLLGYSLLEYKGSYLYMNERGLVERARNRKNNGAFTFVGKKRDQETGYFHINAWMLGDFAKETEKAHQDKAIAVLFRDCDGTRSSSATLWQSKWESIVSGFNRAEFSRGVVMLPKPKSEAWLICAAQSTITNCSFVEDISGNDSSPNSAKLQLDSVFGTHKSGDELCSWINENIIDTVRLSTMPSFKAFKMSLEASVYNLKN